VSPVFAGYARHYDQLYADKDYSGESRYVSGLLSRWRCPGERLLDLGSGTGRHALCLAELGYRVRGVELSPEMLALAASRAAEHAPGLRRSGLTPPAFVQGDMRAVRLGRGFDAVVSLFHALSYQVEDDDLRAAFQTAGAHLRDGGLFLFDAWYGPAVLAELPGPRVKRVHDGSHELVRLAQPTVFPALNVVAVDYRLLVEEKSTGTRTETRERHRLRYVFEPEVAELAGECGFEVLSAGEWLTGRPLGPGTWSACFVLRRAPAGETR
jgi:SAM-dependent methyltransferase